VRRKSNRNCHNALRITVIESLIVDGYPPIKPLLPSFSLLLRSTWHHFWHKV